MKFKYLLILLIFSTIPIFASCNAAAKKQKTENLQVESVNNQDQQNPDLPPPAKSHVNLSNVIGWPEDKTPVAPKGFIVTKYADGFDNPRWMYQTPNGDILVAEANSKVTAIQKIASKVIGKKPQNMGKSGNRIILLRDKNNDGKPDIREEFLGDLNRPFGMLIIGNSFYVANTDGVIKYPYKAGDTKITGKGQKVLDLPAGGYNNHWTRNLIARPDNSKIYVSVGSSSNVGENGMSNENRRANILEINPDGSGERIYASGLRNPVGMAWYPGTNTLWTAVNERDELGDELVPDYLTSVKEGGFYGWPYAYFGQHEDPRLKGERPDLVKKSIIPDVPLGAHTASLGLVFYDKTKFPERYRNGAFIGQHGSWNHSDLVGYKVVFVPFSNGKPSGKPEDFLTGFIADKDKSDVYGRPVGVLLLKDGSLLITDDASNTIWRVDYR